MAHDCRDTRKEAVEAVCECRMPFEEAAGVKCRLCERAAEPELCKFHLEAMANVKRGYPLWVKAYGGMGWKDYLDNVKRNAKTGLWAREVAQLLEETS